MAAVSVTIGLRSGSGELLFGYFVAGLCFLPVTPLDLAFGVRFGIPVGILWAQISATLAAGLAFLVSRHLLRDRLPAFLRGDRRLQRIESVVAKHGWWSVFLARLSPFLPFSSLSWVFGSLRVSFWTHMSATFLATLPKTVVFVTLGATAGRAAEATEIARQGWMLPIARALVFLVILIGAAHLARLVWVQKPRRPRVQVS